MSVVPTPPLVTKSQPAVSSKGYKGLRRKEPRLCYTVSKVGKKNSSPQLSTQEAVSKRGGSQSRAARRSASVHGVCRTRSSLSERQKQPGTGDDSLIHSEVQRKNSCLNAVEMDSGNGAYPKSGAANAATPTTPRDSRLAALRSFASTSGYASLLHENSFSGASTFSPKRRSTPSEAQDQPCRDRSVSFDLPTDRRRRVWFLPDDMANNDANDFAIEDLLAVVSDKMRRIANQLTDPRHLRAMAEVDIHIQDLRLKCREAQQHFKDNEIMKKRIAVLHQFLEEARDNAVSDRNDLMTIINLTQEENMSLAKALDGGYLWNCMTRSDAATQTAPQMKDVATDARPLEAKLDDSAPVKATASLNDAPKVSPHPRRSGKPHAICLAPKTSTALKEIINVLDRVPAEKPESPPSAISLPKPSAAVLMLTKENLFQHERRYLQQEISRELPPVKPKAVGESLKAVNDDLDASDCTLVEADSSSGKSTQVAYMPDNASVISRFSSASTLSSYNSSDHRKFQEGITQLHNHFLKLERNLPGIGATSHRPR